MKSIMDYPKTYNYKSQKKIERRFMDSSELGLIVSKIVELSTKEKSDDPVRNLHSVAVAIDNRIESIMNDMREIERRMK